MQVLVEVVEYSLSESPSIHDTMANSTKNQLLDTGEPQTGNLKKRAYT